MKALIVDSSSTVAYTLSSLFGKFGIDASVAKSGHEALSLLENSTVDILCFAYELGDMNGIEFFVEAKARKLLHHQPGLMFTSTRNRSVTSRAIEAGVTECISKCNLTRLEQFVGMFAASSRNRISGRVLLVEDSDMTALYCRQILERLGLHVDICLSAEDAIERFADHNYDLVVTDYFLAGMGTGFTVIRAVRDTAGEKSSTPILVISAFDDMVRKVEILRNGANDFVAKPVVAEELEVRVCNLLNMRRLMNRLESQHEAMKDLAMRDQLTSLYNRHYLHEEVPGLITDAHEGGLPLSLMVADIDHFKLINDVHGHKAGDLVIEQVAKALQGICRRDDLVARVGGEEFVAVLPGVALEDALIRAEVIRTRIAALKPGGIPITVSIGIAALVEDETYDDLFRRADSAMYRAKVAGRDRVEVVESGLRQDEETRLSRGQQGKVGVKVNNKETFVRNVI